MSGCNMDSDGDLDIYYSCEEGTANEEVSSDESSNYDYDENPNASLENYYNDGNEEDDVDIISCDFFESLKLAEEKSNIDVEKQKVFNSKENISNGKQKVLKFDDLPKEMDKLAQEVSAKMGYSLEICQILLHLFSWNPNKLYEKFFEFGSPEAFFKYLKIQVPLSSNEIQSSTSYGECNICYDTTVLVSLSCNHRFCFGCWKNHLLTRFRQESDPYAFCPNSDCQMIIDSENVIKLLQSEIEKNFYKSLILKDFINTNPCLKWCPSANCNRIIKVQNPGVQPVTCDCGTIFCFECSQEWHEPLPCFIFRQWLARSDKDVKSFKWVSENTRSCPKCGSPIQKTGGCNSMRCENKGCRYSFCWACMSQHTSFFSGCNRYNDDNVNRLTYKRFSHFSSRYENHKLSLKAEARLKEKIQEMQQNSSLPWMEITFLNDAVNTLNKCRRVLMFTYPLAFYLPSNNSTNIFEYNQNDLENATEELSNLLENELDLEEDNFFGLNQKIQDRCFYVEKQCQILLTRCSEGIQHDEWKLIRE